MSKKTVLAGLCVVIAFQITVLAVEYINSVYPLLTGQAVRLKTRPVDPRSLFRGNYVRLNYYISTINGADLAGTNHPRSGEIVYVKLKPGADGFHEYNGVSLERPGDGLFIRGRVKSSRWTGGKFRVDYGIEAFFAPKEKAQALQIKLRKKGAATVMIAKNGRAALKSIGEQ